MSCWRPVTGLVSQPASASIVRVSAMRIFAMVLPLAERAYRFSLYADLESPESEFVQYRHSANGPCRPWTNHKRGGKQKPAVSRLPVAFATAQAYSRLYRGTLAIRYSI